MQSYPFTSKKVGYDEDGMPLYDRAVDSEFLRKVYACYFSDGVFYDQSDRLQVVEDTGMQVKVSPGCVHIQGAIGIEPNQRTLVVQAADDQDRIDTVVARLDLSLDVRSIDLYIVKGTPAESPQAPAMTRDSTTWELGLANLFVAKNVSTISQQRITDTRLDTARCGQVGAPVQPPFDTEAYFTQLEAAIRAHQEDAEAQIEQLRKAIEAVEGDAAWMMKDLYDPAGLGKDVTTQVYTHSKSGTVHEFTGNGAVGRALMTADVEEGDTFAVNGKPVSAYVGAEDATGSMAGSSWNGKWVSFVFDGTAINFKGGGGLSAADKALLIPENIRKDVVLFAGTPREVVGNLFPSDEHNCLASMWNKVYDAGNAPMMANNITDDSPISVTANKITVKRDFKAYIYKKGWCNPPTTTQFTGTSNIPTGQQSFTTGESFSVNLPIGHGNNQTSGILIIFAVNG